MYLSQSTIKTSNKIAVDAGVTIGVGGDVGVFPHGENVYEMELMGEYGGMKSDVAPTVPRRVFIPNFFKSDCFWATNGNLFVT